MFGWVDGKKEQGKVRLTMPTGRIKMGSTSTGGDMGLFASL